MVGDGDHLTSLLIHYSKQEGLRDNIWYHLQSLFVAVIRFSAYVKEKNYRNVPPSTAHPYGPPKYSTDNWMMNWRKSYVGRKTKPNYSDSWRLLSILLRLSGC